MSHKIMRQVWTLPLKPTQKLVLLALADNANDEGVCWPSRENISDKTGLTTKAITDAVNALKTSGLLDIKKMRGNRNQYQISSNLGLAPVVTLGDYSSNRRSPLVVTEGVHSSNLGLLPIYRTNQEPPLEPIIEPVSLNVCDDADADLLAPVAPPVDPWKESDYGFDEFWAVYPKKVGKPAACKNWVKLKPTRELVDQIVANIKARLACGQWSLDRKQFIKHPQGYISEQMWLDEVIPNTFTTPPRGTASVCPTNKPGFIKYDETKVTFLTPEQQAELAREMEDLPF